MSANGGQIVVDFTIDNGRAVVAVKEAGRTLQQLKSTLESTADSVKKLERHNDSLGRKFRDVVLTMGNLRFVAMDVNDVFLRLPMAILKSSSELEKMQILMKGLSKELTEAGKIADAQKGFDFVTNMAKNAPFELKALADTFVKFKTAGIDPTNGSMQALVDSVAKFGGDGNSLKRASVAIQQMAGKGVVSMEELRQQLGEAVPTAMQDMADQMGVSMAELAKVVSTGTLAAGPALDKMLLRMKVNNSGAANEMMKTWSGMTERLKTELSLMSAEVANSSFGDAAKGALGDLTKAIGSDDAKRFAADVGTELGEAVNIIVSFVKTLVEWRKEISTAAGAWLAFKIAAPILESINIGYAKMREGARASAAAAMEAAQQQRAAALSTAEGYRLQAAAAVKASNDAMAAKSREVLAQDRAMDALLAKQAILNNALANRRGGEVIVPALSGLPGLAGVQSVAAVTKANRDLTEELKRQQGASATARAELNALGYAHGGLTRQLVGTTDKVRELERGTVALTASQRAMAAGASLLRGGLALIGGGVGLVTIALIAGVEAWRRWAAAAEEAQARKRRAERKLATDEDLKITNTELARAKKELQEAQAAQVRGGFSETAGGAAVGGQIKKGYADAATREAAIKDASKRVQELERTVSMQEQSLRESNARDRADGYAKQAQTLIDAADAATQKEIAASRERQAKLTATDKRTVAERAKETQLQTQLTMRAKKEQNAALAAEAERMRSITTDAMLPLVDRDAAQARLQDISRQLKENSDEIVAMAEANDRKIESVGKEKKGGKAKAEPLGYSKVDSLIGNLKAQQAQLQTEIQSFNATLGIVDKGLAAAAAIEAKAKAGAYRYHDPDSKNKKAIDISAAELAEAKKLAQMNADMQQALQVSEQIATKGRDIKGDYEVAMKILTDPLNGVQVSDRGQTGQFVDMLEKAGVSIDKLAEKMGKTREQVEADIAEIKRQLTVIDMAKPMSDLAADTQRLNIEIITSDRERTRQQLELDARLYVARHQALIDQVRATVGTNAQVMAYEKQLGDWKVANAASVAERMKTPMQRLADQWMDSAKAMEDATARWAQNGIDEFINFAKTGKFEWQSLVTDVLAGLLKIKLQKELVGLLDFGGSSGKGGGAGGSSEGWISMLGKWATSFFTFADGGIMSALGSVPLKQYAAGGIANSPQMAVFGEGDMNEAYVPLPDGRSIPVTMKTERRGDEGEGGARSGGNAPSVTVNVINQSGQAVETKQGAPRFDGEKLILDVVLAKMNQPGSFRDGMRGALGVSG